MRNTVTRGSSRGGDESARETNVGKEMRPAISLNRPYSNKRSAPSGQRRAQSPTDGLFILLLLSSFSVFLGDIVGYARG